jgi:hypothetical protein
MASGEERFDGVLLSIAQVPLLKPTECSLWANSNSFRFALQNISKEHGGIAELLDVFLGFLRRKTDAFNPPGGFPQL